MRAMRRPNEGNAPARALAEAGPGARWRLVYLVKNQYSGSSMASGLLTTLASLLLVAVTA